MTPQRAELLIEPEAAGLTPFEPRPTRIPVFDSGLGGLTVLREISRALPGADLLFAADDAMFPYGRLSEQVLVDRVMVVIGRLVARFQPHVVVIACGTASTAVLPPLRARWPEIAFVGTVPAIKPAAALSISRQISVLATPGTVAREYTRDLIRSFAGGCTVTLVGSPLLASFAEAIMRGETIDDGAVAAEIAPAFVVQGEARTDAVVLACTRHPLLLDRLKRLAPWPVTWIDPAPAIARRVEQVLADRGRIDAKEVRTTLVPAVFTSGKRPEETLRDFLASVGVEAAQGIAV